MNEKKIWNHTQYYPRTVLGIFLFLMGTLLFACQPQVVEVEVEKVVEVEVTREVEVVTEVEVEVVKEVEVIPTAGVEFGSQPEIDATGAEEGDGSPFEPDSTQKVAGSTNNQIRLATDPADTVQTECATFLSSDFSLSGSNQSAETGLGTLQLIIWYDGLIADSTLPQLQIELQTDFATQDENDQPYLTWLSIGGESDAIGTITTAEQLVSREYRLTNCLPTGRFIVTNTAADGDPDGLAFGLYYRHSDGSARLYKSGTDSLMPETSFVGIVPVSITPGTFEALTPMLTSSEAQGQAQAMIYGAQLLPDGLYEIR